jgi:hypothetical protein
LVPDTPSRAIRLGTLLLASRRWVVLAMLVALHAALVGTSSGEFQRIWLLVHFGLFLLWQPFFAAEQELGRLAIFLLVALTGAILYFLPGWLIGAWICILMGILGGKVFTTHALRRSRFYLVAFFYLAALMLLWVAPRFMLPGHPIPEPVIWIARWALPVPLVVLALLPFETGQEDAQQVFDFFYAVLVFQLVVVLVLGAIAVMRYTDEDYFASAGLTVIGFGATLFVLAVLWGPRGGFGGLRSYLSRYLLSVGMPFETWVRRVAELAERESDPHRFLEQSLRLVAELPWVRGGRWRTREEEGAFGAETPHSVRFAFHGLEVTLHTEIAFSPALFLHMRLLAQVIAEFHESKRREAAMRRNAYLQAVHETGARLTHDIKNLLQSLYALTSAAPREGGTDAGYTALLQRQLPQLTRRLQSSVDQLRSPEVETREALRPARAWWADLERRHGGAELVLASDIAGEATVPADLFDAFLENCLDNARRRGGASIGMKAALSVAGGVAVLRFENAGEPVPAAVARTLFREPVPAEKGGGLGIGLYQVGRLAVQSGYAIDLEANEPGRVVFRLQPA